MLTTIRNERVHLVLIATMATSIGLLHVRLIATSRARRMTMTMSMTVMKGTSTVRNWTERLRARGRSVRTLEGDTMLIWRTCPACTWIVVA